MQEERAAHHGCRLKHGRQGGGDTAGRTDGGRWRRWWLGGSRVKHRQEKGDGKNGDEGNFMSDQREKWASSGAAPVELSSFTVRPSWISCHNFPVNPSEASLICEALAVEVAFSKYKMRRRFQKEELESGRSLVEEKNVNTEQIVLLQSNLHHLAVQTQVSEFSQFKDVRPSVRRKTEWLQRRNKIGRLHHRNGTGPQLAQNRPVSPNRARL